MKLLGRLLRFVRPYWGGAALSVVLVLMLGTFRLGPAWFVKLIIDQAVPARDLSLAALFIAGLVGTAAMTNGLNAAELYLEGRGGRMRSRGCCRNTALSSRRFSGRRVRCPGWNGRCPCQGYF